MSNLEFTLSFLLLRHKLFSFFFCHYKLCFNKYLCFPEYLCYRPQWETPGHGMAGSEISIPSAFLSIATWSQSTSQQQCLKVLVSPTSSPASFQIYYLKKDCPCIFSCQSVLLPLFSWCVYTSRIFPLSWPWVTNPPRTSRLCVAPCPQICSLWSSPLQRAEFYFC